MNSETDDFRKASLKNELKNKGQRKGYTIPIEYRQIDKYEENRGTEKFLLLDFRAD